MCATGAAMGCQALRSEVFEPCHAHIPVQVFLTKCEEQTCEESDVCELISAYARLCRQRGVCVDWRSPHLCRKSVFDVCMCVCVCVQVNMSPNLNFNLICILQRYSAPAPWSMTPVGQVVLMTVGAYRRCQATGPLPGVTSQPVWTHLLRAVSALEGRFCITDSVCHRKLAGSVSTSMDARIR